MLPEEIVVQLDEGAYILISAKIVSTLRSHSQDGRATPESGGLLVGMVRGPHFELTDISTPSPSDVRTRHSFERRCKSHVEVVRSSWRRSMGYEAYLGEWHTHPERHPKPSVTDLRSWNVGLPKTTRLILLIVGTESLWVGLWTGSGVKYISNTLI